MFRYVPVVLAFVFIVGLGAYQGILSDRWSDPGVEIQEFADRLKNVPMIIGDWKGTDQEVDSQSIRGSGAMGYVSRVYVNKVTRKTVNLWFICGHPRDISMHTPDVCYPAVGFTQQDQKIRYPIPLDESSQDMGDFFTALFRKEDIRTNRLERVFWSWSRPDVFGWQAPDSPRITFGGVQALYKIYFVSAITDRTETVDQNVCREFAKVFMPEVRRAMFPETSEADATSDPAAATDGEAS